MTRPSRTVQDMFPLVEAYFERQQTKKAFCAQHGVPQSVLTYWVTKYRREQAAEPGAFVEITPSAGSNERVLMEVVYPHGVRLRLFSPLPAADLERLLAPRRRLA